MRQYRQSTRCLASPLAELRPIHSQNAIGCNCNGLQEFVDELVIAGRGGNSSGGKGHFQRASRSNETFEVCVPLVPLFELSVPAAFAHKGAESDHYRSPRGFGDTERSEPSANRALAVVASALLAAA